MKSKLRNFVKERKSGKKSYIYTAILFLTLFTVYQYGIHRIYGMSEYPDEFGYWSTAAHMIGWDWSQLASRGSYYSFGYSLILFPILKFCEDSVSAYRVAVSVNFSFMAISFFFLKGIYKRIFAEQVEGEEILAIGLAILYPAWSFYAQTTLVDSLLIFMIILISYLWLRFVEVPSLKWGIALVAAVIYNYSLHMRSAGILAAVIISLALWVWKYPSHWKKFFFLLLTVLASFLLVSYIKDVVQGNVFVEATAERLNVNDFGGQWSKVEFLFSLEGLRQAFVIVMGKVLYLGVAGAGLVYAAFVWCGEQVILWWKNIIFVGNHKRKIWLHRRDGAAKNEDVSVKTWFGVLLILMILGQIAVCVIYTIRTNNVDWLIYGRYIEAFVPLAIFVGASYILQKRLLWKMWLGFLGIDTLAAFTCICKVWGKATDNIRGVHSVATAFLIGDGNVEPVRFLIMVWGTGLLVMMLTGFLFHQFQKGKFSIGIMGIICAVLAMGSIHASEKYTYEANCNMSGELILVNVLEEQLAEEKNIYYVEEKNENWISYVQMQLRQQTLEVITIEELERLEPENCAVVVDGESQYLEYMEEHYNRKITGNYHYVFYNN